MGSTRRASGGAIFNVAVFVVAAVLWVVFAALLLWRPEVLAGLWDSFLAQPWLLQGIEFILLLPWAVALWIWNTDWWLWIRVVLVLGLAGVNLVMFWPWRGNSGPAAKG